MRPVLNPAYLHRPSQVVRRVRCRHGEHSVRLPWGLPITFSADELVGACIARRGVIELATTELIWRLVDPGDVAMDVGANFGYFASLMSARGARVVAFEPHPEVYAALERNARAWPATETREQAVSDRAGVAILNEPEEHHDLERFNQGLASLVPMPNATGIEVETVTLDDLISEPVGLLKVDVEGHEPAVLRGAHAALEAGLVRDVVFEDYDGEGSESKVLLRELGFSLFGIHEDRRGARLVDPGSPEAVPWREAPNFLATRDPVRALARVGPGWLSLRGRPA